MDMGTIQLTLNSQQALSLMKLVSLRLEYLASKQLTSSEQIELQSLRSIALQLRDGAQEKVLDKH